jgi:hypothetical protein
MPYQLVKYQPWNRKSIVTRHSKWSRGRRSFLKALTGPGYDAIWTDNGVSMWAHVMIPGDRDFTLSMSKVD